uniref:Uncharacterized protein n=1 Tax=Parascaris equorum TaxID=6256 RepID=A0A914RR08_PAREQ
MTTETGADLLQQMNFSTPSSFDLEKRVFNTGPRASRTLPTVSSVMLSLELCLHFCRFIDLPYLSFLIL